MATRSGLGRRLHTHEHSMCCRPGTNMGETQCLYLEIDRHNQHHDATQPNHIVSPLLLSSHQYQQILERCMYIRQHGSAVYVGIHAGPRISPPRIHAGTCVLQRHLAPSLHLYLFLWKFMCQLKPYTTCSYPAATHYNYTAASLNH